MTAAHLDTAAPPGEILQDVLTYELCQRYTQMIVETMGAPTSVSEVVAARIRERILAHTLPAGARVGQVELAEELGVSRVPVRDALRQLASEGLIDLRGRSGAVVARLSLSDLQELYELREAVEPLAARIAVPNVGRAQLHRMAGALEVMVETSDPIRWLEANVTFHGELYHHSGRPRMIALIDNLRRQADRYIRLHLEDVESTGHLQVEHQQILDAARARDPDAIERLTLHHLATSHDFILAQLLEHDRSGDVEDLARSSSPASGATGHGGGHR